MQYAIVNFRMVNGRVAIEKHCMLLLSTCECQTCTALKALSFNSSDSVGDDMSASVMSLPTTDSATSSQMRVLTRHAGSRKKRRTDSMRSLVTNMEDYERK